MKDDTISRTNKKVSVFGGENMTVEIIEVFDGIGNYEYTEVKVDGKTTAIHGSTIEAVDLGLPAEAAEEIKQIWALER